MDGIQKKRILWLDGIKGMACMLVFVHHFVVGFYPAMYYGDAAKMHIGRFPMLESEISQSPFAFFLNGHFMVCLFCMISALVMSRGLLRASQREKAAGSMVAKRYFRIVIPVFFTQLIVFLMQRCGLFWSVQAGTLTGSHQWLETFYRESYSFRFFLKNTFIDVPFVGDSTYNTAFWMLNQLLLGSLISVALCMMAACGKRQMLLICLIWTVGLLHGNHFYASFSMGTMLALLIGEREPRSCWPSIAMIAAGCFLGGYPTGRAPDNVYALLLRLFPQNTYFICHQIGAMLLLLGVSGWKPAKRLFASRVMLFLSRISFSVFLIHAPLMCSFSCALFLLMRRRGIHYSLTCAAVLAVTFVLLPVLAVLYHRTVERASDRITNRIMRMLEKLESDCEKQNSKNDE